MNFTDINNLEIFFRKSLLHVRDVCNSSYSGGIGKRITV
jgi:hypothetical protein